MFRIQRIADENPSDPFIARLRLGILELRDQALRCRLNSNDIDSARERFDDLYDPVLQALGAARSAANNIEKTVGGHIQKLATGEIVKFQPSAYEISESVDKPLRDETATFLVNGVIAMKSSQTIVELFGVNIGCIFTKQANFEKGANHLSGSGHDSLARYLRDVRLAWSESFIDRRNTLEHEAWNLPPVKYTLNRLGGVETTEPEVDGVPVRRYTGEMFNRISAFVENVIVYAYKQAFWAPVALIEIPREQRDPGCPTRFRLDLKRPGIEEWNIRYVESDFP